MAAYLLRDPGTQTSLVHGPYFNGIKWQQELQSLYMNVRQQDGGTYKMKEKEYIPDVVLN